MSDEFGGDDARTDDAGTDEPSTDHAGTADARTDGTGRASADGGRPASTDAATPAERTGLATDERTGVVATLTDPVERFVESTAGRLAQVVLVLGFAFLWLPIAVLVFMSFAAGGVLSFPPEQLTLRWYRVFLENDAAIGAIWTTLSISVPATAITVVLATLISYAVDRFVFRGRRALQLLATLPVVVPLVVTGVALVLFFRGTLGLRGYPAVVVAHVIRTIPFATLVILPTFLSFDRRLEEASKDLGADELRTFIQVTLPNVFPGIIAGSLLAFTLSFNEFVFTYFVKGTGDPTLPVYIWNQIRYNVTPEVNVISVVFLVVAIGLVLVAVSLTRVNLLARG